LDNGKPTLVLGIETTCDETAAAVVERQSDGSGKILSNIVRSQTEEHARFGGVVPEIAARAHVDLLDGIVDSAMKESGVGFAQLSAVAAAAGPGLIGGVIVGLTTAKAIAMVHNTPLIAVNHLEAHALTPRLTCALAFPYCLFLASGGHTQIVAVIGVGKYVRLGTTVDDAMGEAFDKVAKMLGLPYPGGPELVKTVFNGATIGNFFRSTRIGLSYLLTLIFKAPVLRTNRKRGLAINPILFANRLSRCVEKLSLGTSRVLRCSKTLDSGIAMPTVPVCPRSCSSPATRSAIARRMAA